MNRLPPVVREKLQIVPDPPANKKKLTGDNWKPFKCAGETAKESDNHPSDGARLVLENDC